MGDCITLHYLKQFQCWRLLHHQEGGETEQKERWDLCLSLFPRLSILDLGESLII